MRWIVVACLVTTMSCGKRAAAPDRRAELERKLREESGEPLRAAATEYRELMAEQPDALRKIADAYGLRGERAARVEVLRTLILRGQDTRDERLKALELAHELGRVDDAMYQTGLGWLRTSLAREPWCATFAQLVTWTEGHPEHTQAIEEALAGCPRDSERAAWWTARARAPDAAADAACQAVSYGESTLAEQCLASGATGWRVDVATALRDDDRVGHLRAAAQAPDVTAYVLLELARTPGVPVAEACAALARARTIEVGWLPRAGDASAIEGRYRGLRQAASCP